MENNNGIPYVKVNNRGSFNRGFNRGGNYRRNTYSTNYQKPVSAREQVPEVYSKLVSILKHNADIRRFASFGVINFLKQTKIVPCTSKCYVKFLWNKVAVRFDNRTLEYPYSEKFVINAILASFNSFAIFNLNIVDEFVQYTMKKGVNEITTSDEINAIANGIIESANNSDDEPEDNSEGDGE